MNTAIFSTAYLPPIQYFALAKKYDTVFIEQYEHFVKQTYRSRCHIYGANGMLKLTVPIQHSGERTPIKDIKISYSDNWQKIHWKSIESAYRCSPYFEFYENDFAPYFLENKFEHLVELNWALLQLLLKLLKLNISISKNNEYIKNILEIADYREKISPKLTTEKYQNYNAQQYIQVFGNKHGFIPNLSIIDLLFNEGPQACDLL